MVKQAVLKQETTVLTEVIQTSKLAVKHALLLSCVSNFLMLVLPVYSLQVLDRVISSGNMTTLLMLSLLMLGALVALVFIQMARSFMLVKTGQWFDKKLSGPLFAHSVRASVVQKSLGGSQVLRDLQVLKGFITGQALIALLDAPWAMIFIVVLWLLHPVYGIITVIGGVVLMVIAVMNEQYTKRLFDASNEYYLRAMNQVELATRNAEVVEAMGMLGQLTRNWQVANHKMTDLQNEANQYANVFSSISRFVRMALQIIITGGGGYLALKGEVSVGAIIASSILVGRALAPFENAIASWKGVISVRKSFSRLQQSLVKKSERNDAMQLPVPEGKLTVEHLFFKIPTEQKPILQDIDFSLSPGEILGVIGPTASGKTTLSKLLVGIWQPVAGKVRLDNADVYTWQREDFGKHVGFLPQDIELFDGDIKTNIARMDVQAPPEAVVAAAKMAHVHDLILHLPQGYETQIGVGGAVLSAGQRQRIGLARAFFGLPKLVVLDEPNANLDHEGDTALAATLVSAKKKGITLVVISHRPSIMSVVDTVMVLKKGKIAAYGPKEEVLAKLNEGVGADKKIAVPPVKMLPKKKNP